MGIPGLLKAIGKGERIALSKLAVEFLERNRRPLRIAIDIAIWQFQNQAGQGGQNPALRTFYYRLLRLLALPIHPLFVYDGPKKPLAKRNKVVSRYGTTSLHNEMSKKLLQLFRFPYRTAPGEAEAECALLQQEGIVDAVMSQDVDAVMWGSTMTLRDWSQEGTRGNKTATHVNVLRAEETRTKTGLDPEGMILVAILSGGDYAPDGVPGFGPGLACELAAAHCGSDLWEIMSKGDKAGLAEWKDRLHYELETNESGYFKTKHKSVKLPVDFPDETILRYYTHPAVSTPSELRVLQTELEAAWDGDVDVTEMREYVAQTFNWQYRGGACKFIRSLAPALLAQRLLRGRKNTTLSSQAAILERRMHFVSDGMPELRVAAIPADIVGLDIEDEADNPEYIEAMENTAGAAAATEEDPDGPVNMVEPEREQLEPAPNTSRPRQKAAPWDPRNPEKMWLPETIVKLGIPIVVEEWEQKQRDMLSDPKKLIANKARKINPPTAASQQTKSITSYFATAKPNAARQPVRPTSPKKALNVPLGAQDERSVRAASTPNRQKAKSTVNNEPNPLVTSSTNPFSLASQARSKTTTSTASKSFPRLHVPTTATSSSSNNNNTTLQHPIRRKPCPLQKSKTLPASFPETEGPIIISSSPLPPATRSPHRRRPSTPPRRPPQTQSPTANLHDNDDDNDSSDSLPSPSHLLLQTNPTQKPPRRPPPQKSPSNLPISKHNPIPLSEIFRLDCNSSSSGSTIAATTTRTALVADNPKEVQMDGKKKKKKGEKMLVVPRDSLPGTWREALEFEAEMELEGEGEGGRGRGGRGRKLRRERERTRVSLVDLTD